MALSAQEQAVLPLLTVSAVTELSLLQRQCHGSLTPCGPLTLAVAAVMEQTEKLEASELKNQVTWVLGTVSNFLLCLKNFVTKQHPMNVRKEHTNLH